MVRNSILILLATVATLISIASAKPGIATFYTDYAVSACYGRKNMGVMIAAAGDVEWKNGTACGKMLTVKCTGARNPVPHPCTGKSVTVKIVNWCPGCPSTFDLSREAFTQIANPVAGIINIDYKLF